ncbi:MAG: ABC transporter ATP-binding protein [Arachnia sp.]
MTKRFTAGSAVVTALDGVTASVRSREAVALLGSNGAGKTTCMDLVCGVTQPTQGEVIALGGAPRRAVHEGRMTAVLQTGGLLRDLTVLETVQVMAGLHRRPERVWTVLAEAGLTSVAKRLVGRCSGGEQQRLKYALALIPDPEILVLDEPAAGLDMEARAGLWEHVRQRLDSGTTIIYSTHHLAEVEGMAERVLLLRDGKLVADRQMGELVGSSAPRRISAELADAAAVVEALRALTKDSVVQDDGSVDGRIILRAAPDVSDAVAARLLGEFRGTRLTVVPQTVHAALEDFMAGGS